MEVELTARQVRIPKALRQQAEEGMDRIARILGKTTSASITFRVQRHLHIAELTVKARMHTIAAAGQADSQEAALRAALSHAEHQALRYRDRHLTRKRLPKEEKEALAPPVTRPKTRAAAPGAESEEGESRPRASIPVHSFPARRTVVEPHVVKSGEAIALRPMTLEEAVKEAEFRDRDLLIYRNVAGELFVLHRRRDGQMELVEIP
ncbi:MAG TPA: HPF/RaiA family ribosome-associated protein [Terracidiphilus sp.]|jgi:putative sigma-54 modulation protein|nr:HPF/RaiA family ribosome-associated protein [Terracidiphilus sp.]